MRQVRLVREYAGLELLDRLRPQGLSAQPRFLRDREWVVALDAMLTTRQHRQVLPRPGWELLTAAADLSVVVLSGPDGTELHAQGPVIALPVRDADAAVVLDGGRLLLTAAHPTSEGHQVHLVDLRRRTVVETADLDCEQAQAVLIAHPHDGSVLVDLSEGNAGSRLYAVHLDAGRLRTRELLQDTVPAGFNPGGTHLLVLPHPSFDEEAWLASWPDGEPVASLATAALGWEDDAFDVTGCFLDEHSVLLLTGAHGVVLTDGRLENAQALELGDGVTGVVGLWPGLFATGHVVDALPSTRVWQLSPP